MKKSSTLPSCLSFVIVVLLAGCATQGPAPSALCHLNDDNGNPIPPSFAGTLNPSHRGHAATHVVLVQNADTACCEGFDRVVFTFEGFHHPTWKVRYVSLPIQQCGSGNNIAVVSGVQPGDTIVADGSFGIRAERDRLGLRVSDSTAPAPATAPTQVSAAGGTTSAQEAKVLVTEKGYEPTRLTVRSGQPARITFVRTTDKTCGTEVVFPSLNIRRPLPLNEPVVVEFTPKASGEIGFVCGMNMLRGTVVVQ